MDLFVDEWGGWYDVEPGTNGAFLYQQNTMRDAMLASATLNIFNNHADRVKMANIAQTVNVLQAVILTKEEKMLLTPTYHVFKMFNVHQDATLLPSEIHNGAYYNSGKESLPAVSCSASKNAAGEINISIVNIDANKKNIVDVVLNGATVKNVKGTVLKSAKIQDHNTFDNPEKVQPTAFNDFKLEGKNIKVTVPPFSVVVLNVK
ncbi:MAG: alpha-L-arabinofuranosidase C-terminal domain-containing protein [Saprospiraceae bacterium]